MLNECLKSVSREYHIFCTTTDVSTKWRTVRFEIYRQQWLWYSVCARGPEIILISIGEVKCDRRTAGSINRSIVCTVWTVFSEPIDPWNNVGYIQQHWRGTTDLFDFKSLGVAEEERRWPTGNGDAVVEGFLEERHEGGRRLRPVPCPPHTGNVYALSALFATTDRGFSSVFDSYGHVSCQAFNGADEYRLVLLVNLPLSLSLGNLVNFSLLCRD